jgi:hypothetical protein
MVPRHITKALKHRAAEYPIVIVTGPRQSGKTTLAQQVFPSYDYVSLEAPDIRARAVNDPRDFLEEHDRRVILDEAQHAPDLSEVFNGLLDTGFSLQRVLDRGNWFVVLARRK